MDPLMSAMLATHDRPAPPTRRERRRRAWVEPLAGWWQLRDGLAWSALPHAPVVAHQPLRADDVRQRLAIALLRVVDKIDGGRRARQVAESNC